MKIAVLTVTYNDDYKIDQWVQLYKEYKDQISYHIIIDNGSNKEYLDMVKTYFKDSIIIEREFNGGSTIAYNDGIKYVLENTDAEKIMLLGNDIRIYGEDIIKLSEFLNNNRDVGMVAPLLLGKDNTTIDQYGCDIDDYLALNPYMVGKSIDQISDKVHFCETVAGGVNMADISFYKQVGLQDETLFMYSDEVDMGLRAKKLGFKFAAIADAKSWHLHINPDKGRYRSPYASYLLPRNKIYLCDKHGLKKSKVLIVTKFLYLMIKQFAAGILRRNRNLWLSSKFTFMGIINGLKGDMAINEYVLEY